MISKEDFRKIFVSLFIVYPVDALIICQHLMKFVK